MSVENFSWLVPGKLAASGRLHLISIGSGGKNRNLTRTAIGGTLVSP